MSGMRADLSVGERLRCDGARLRVEGCLLFKEWDRQDGQYCYWEEWRLSRTTEYGVQEMWVELDHDDGRVHLYEPLPFAELPDPGSLAPGQILTLTSGTDVYHDVYAARVAEVGVGVLEQALGTTACGLAQGQEMMYAEIELTDARGATKQVTVDSHGFRDLVSYRKRPLTRTGQRRLFGKVIAAGGPGHRDSADSSERWSVPEILVVALVVVLCLVMMACCDDDDDGGGVFFWRRRSVYGGGGRGVGK